MADNKVNSGLLEFSEDQKVFVALDAETSEVQKAVTIDGDGVETDIQGVQPSGKKEITSTAEVNVANYATAQVVDEDLIASNIKKDVDILGVVGSYEPEAPASDLKTAKVKLIKTGSGKDNVVIVDFEKIRVPQSGLLKNPSTNAEYVLSEGLAMMYEAPSTLIDELTFDIILNTNGVESVAYIDADTSSIVGVNMSEQPVTYSNIAVSGDASIADDVITITGDCTITLTFNSES